MSLNLSTRLLMPLETSSSMGMFVRDTGGCLISRLGMSRSKDETREISIAELSESALFYFSAPAVAKMSGDFFSKIFKNNNQKGLQLSKLGQILSTFSLILPLVYGIAPVRNLITLNKTGKDEFTSVIGLQDKKADNKKDNNALKKLTKNLAKIAILGIGLTGITLGLLNNDKIYNKTEPFVDKFVKNFGFTKENDLKMLHYGALIYPVSVAGYFKASRDKYEKMENARRFSTTIPLMFFGEKLIQNPIYKTVDKIFKTNVFNEGKIKTYDEILKRIDGKDKLKMLKSKNIAFGLTFFINTIFIAGAVALLNRIKTKENYIKDKTREHKCNMTTLDVQKLTFKDFKEEVVQKQYLLNQKQKNN